MRTRLQGESAFHFEQIGVVDVLQGRLRLAVHGKDGVSLRQSPSTAGLRA